MEDEIVFSEGLVGLNRTSRALRLGGLLLVAGIVCGSCSKSTPTAPTPPPVSPPVISCPASQSLTSPLATPIPVVYGTPTVSGGTSPITTTCTPVSGSTFPLGTTAVTCTATDAQQRVSTCSLTVAVARPPQLSVSRFVAFGDSITAGEDGQNSITSEVGGLLQFDQSIILFGFEYPSVLRTALQARYTEQAGAIAVLNAGSPGESAGSAATLARFSSSIAGFQVVLLLEGSNDLSNAYSGGSAFTDAAITGLQSMVRRAKTAGVRPYLATVPPMNPNACTPICRGRAAGLVNPFNDRIRALAVAEGATLVDVNQGFNGDLTLLSSDGLHPAAGGYDRIADAFFQRIKATLEPTSTALSTASR